LSFFYFILDIYKWCEETSSCRVDPTGRDESMLFMATIITKKHWKKFNRRLKISKEEETG
jgi:hypothetical protein